MKTTSLIIAALLFSTSLVIAQNEKKPMKVRIKKVQLVNGVEKVIDTTFTTNDPALIIKDLPELNLDVVKSTAGESTIITEDIAVGELLLTEEMQWLQSELGELKPQPNSGECKKIVMVETSSETSDEHTKAGPKKLTKIIIKTHKVLDPTKEELKLLGINDTEYNPSLELRELSFAPNPSNGITGIELVLPKKGPTTISVYNINGALVYEDKLGDFTGRYQKQLDLSAQPKGIYFLRVEQNDAYITKKLIIE